MGDAEVTALEKRRAFVDLSSWRKIAVAGSDAITWLNDLVSNRVDDIRPNEARRTLLLDRTGRIRADVHATTLGGRDGDLVGLLLIQDPAQPVPIEELLAPYQLSSDVDLEDRTDRLAWFVMQQTALAAVQFMWWPGPSDRIAYTVSGAGDRERVRDVLAGSYTEAREPDVEVWRVRRGVPRYGVDFGEDTVAAEARWDELVDRTKGCFLGQEAVAKVANLGHPPRLFTSFSASVALEPGDPVFADGQEAGRVTSVAPDADVFAVIARIRWDARTTPLRTAAGDPLSPR
jgi:tRNA-modifying protein YgfZ